MFLNLCRFSFDKKDYKITKYDLNLDILLSQDEYFNKCSIIVLCFFKKQTTFVDSIKCLGTLLTINKKT